MGNQLNQMEFTPLDTQKDYLIFYWKDFDHALEAHLDFLLSLHLENFKAFHSICSTGYSKYNTDEYTFDTISLTLIKSYPSVQKLSRLSDFASKIVFVDSTIRKEDYFNIIKKTKDIFKPFISVENPQPSGFLKMVENYFYNIYFNNSFQNNCNLGYFYYNSYIAHLTRSLHEISYLYKYRSKYVTESFTSYCKPKHPMKDSFIIYTGLKDAKFVERKIPRNTDFQDACRFVAESRRIYSKLNYIQDKLKMPIV